MNEARLVDLPEEDVRRHRPLPDEDDTWQESFFLGWYDPVNRCGSLNHFSLKDPRNKAHVWSLVAVGDEVVGRFQDHNLPLPDGDLTDLTVGPATLRSPGGSAYQFSVQYKGASSDLSFSPYPGSVEQSVEVSGFVRAKRHYENVGRVEGKLVTESQTLDISGVAFQDHSWGPRRLGLNPGRWIFASFGEDISCSLYTFGAGSARAAVGWVRDSTGVHIVDRSEFGAVVDDDGLSPLACDTRVWTMDGRGYHLTGKVDMAHVWGGAEWWAADGFAQFEMGGRLGAGILEVKELRSLTPEQLEALNID